MAAEARERTAGTTTSGGSGGGAVRRGRARPSRPARPARLGVLAALAVMGAALVGGCGRGGDDHGLTVGGQAGDPVLPDEVALDRCGNDLSGLTTTVRAVDPATGAVRWTTTVPLIDQYLLRSAGGNPQLPLVGRSVEVELDRATGEVVAYPPAGAHEVLVDVAGSSMRVDGEEQPDAPVVGGLTLSTGYGAVAAGGPRLTATDASGTVVWQLDLGAEAAGGSVSRPVAYGDTVVVAASLPRPDEACIPKG